MTAERTSIWYEILWPLLGRDFYFQNSGQLHQMFSTLSYAYEFGLKTGFHPAKTIYKYVADSKTDKRAEAV